MTKNEWQKYHGFLDQEMVKITAILAVFGGTITKVVNMDKNQRFIDV